VQSLRLNPNFWRLLVHRLGVQKLQKALPAKAKAEPGYRFYALYDKISREDILAHAYAQCRSDKGGAGRGPSGLRGRRGVRGRSMPMHPIIRRFQRTATAVSVRAICCASCSILFFAWRSERNQGFTVNSDDYELSLVGSARRPNLLFKRPARHHPTALARATVSPRAG
jgi:hypothetical protein